MKRKAEAEDAREWAEAHDQADSRPTTEEPATTLANEAQQNTPRFALVAERNRQNKPAENVNLKLLTC